MDGRRSDGFLLLIGIDTTDSAGYSPTTAYDVTSRESFDALPTWFNELETFTSSPDVVKVVVGNKIDKEHARAVTAEEGKAFADKRGCLFVECSAKRGVGVDGAFDDLVNGVRGRRVDSEEMSLQSTQLILNFDPRTDRLDTFAMAGDDWDATR